MNGTRRWRMCLLLVCLLDVIPYTQLQESEVDPQTNPSESDNVDHKNVAEIPSTSKSLDTGASEDSGESLSSDKEQRAEALESKEPQQGEEENDSEKPKAAPVTSAEGADNDPVELKQREAVEQEELEVKTKPNEDSTSREDGMRLHNDDWEKLGALLKEHVGDKSDKAEKPHTTGSSEGAKEEEHQQPEEEEHQQPEENDRHSEVSLEHRANTARFPSEVVSEAIPSPHKVGHERVHDEHFKYCVKRSELHEETGVHVAAWRWTHIRTYYSLALFIIIAGLAKLGFHYTHWLSSKMPESCLLIILGIAMGILTYHLRHYVHEEEFPKIRLPGGTPIGPCTDDISGFLPKFDSELFFLVLLPPIILEAAYSLHDRTFGSNLCTILLYAVMGTILNMFIIGPLLYILAKYGGMGSGMYPAAKHFDIKNVSFVEMLTFASLIVAVDPVAVLAIFQEVGVNKDLYFLVFGESLLNDAVTVVLYNAMVAFTGTQDEPMEPVQILLAFAAFFAVSLGGLSIGIVFGLLTAIITKFTAEVPVCETLCMLIMAYLSYLTAELVHFSGIIATVGCGVVQAHYAMKNISKNSCTTVKYFIAMASATSDTIIFMFLGMVLISDDHSWHTGFCLWTLALCLVGRFLVTYALTALANRYRMNRIGKKEQFIMAYGGLRGAVGFSLVIMLYDTTISKATVNMFVTCTLFIVLFTVFVQGSTIKILVSFFKIKLDEADEKTMSEEIICSSIDHLLAGMEEVAGHGMFSRLKERLEYFDENYMTRWLVKKSASTVALTDLYDKMVLDEHYANLYGPQIVLEQRSKPRGNSVSTGIADTAVPNAKNTTLNYPGEINPNALLVNDKLSTNTEFTSAARRLSSMNLPLPEDERHWLQRIAMVSGDSLAGSRPLDQRRPSIMPVDLRNNTLLVPYPANRRRSSVIDELKNSLTRRLSTYNAEYDQEVGDRGILALRTGDFNERATLRQAIRDNPFNKLHQKYNPNLVDVDDQDLESHLRRRRMNARRVSQMVLMMPTDIEGDAFSRAHPERNSHKLRRSQRKQARRDRSRSLENQCATCDRSMAVCAGHSPGHTNNAFTITEESEGESARTGAGSDSSATPTSRRRAPDDSPQTPPTSTGFGPPQVLVYSSSVDGQNHITKL